MYVALLLIKLTVINNNLMRHFVLNYQTLYTKVKNFMNFKVFKHKIIHTFL